MIMGKIVATQTHRFGGLRTFTLSLALALSLSSAVCRLSLADSGDGDGDGDSVSQGEAVAVSAAVMADAITVADMMSEVSNTQADLATVVAEANLGIVGPDTVAVAVDNMNNAQMNATFAFGALQGIIATEMNISLTHAESILSDLVGLVMSNPSSAVAPVIASDPTLPSQVVAVLTSTDPHAGPNCAANSNCVNAVAAVVGQIVVNVQSGSNPFISRSNYCTTDEGASILPLGASKSYYLWTTGKTCPKITRKCQLMNGIPTLSGSGAYLETKCTILKTGNIP